MSTQEFLVGLFIIVTSLTFAANFCNLLFYSIDKGLNRIPKDLFFPRTLLFMMMVEVLICCYLVGTMTK